jgi:hypothetical protein
MRLWTLHPKYLDTKGLVALWREGLLARAVLRGKTRGYTRHPQLERFRAHPTPVACINAYLHVVRDEAVRRGYDFDGSRIGPRADVTAMIAHSGQIEYEWQHLLRKLRTRSPAYFEAIAHQQTPRAHPLFKIRRGPMASWERSG